MLVGHQTVKRGGSMFLSSRFVKVAENPITLLTETLQSSNMSKVINSTFVKQSNLNIRNQNISNHIISFVGPTKRLLHIQFLQLSLCPGLPRVVSLQCEGLGADSEKPHHISQSSLVSPSCE